MENKRKVATLIPYYAKDNEVFVFLQKRDSGAPLFPNHFGFFGGHLEEGENPDQTIVREIKEELDIDITGHIFNGEYDCGDWINYSYIMKVDDDFENKVTVLEGEYGKFFSQEDITKTPNLIEKDQIIVKGLYQYIENKT